mgnify:CR=1 FL=1
MSEPKTAISIVSPKEAPTREKPKEKQMSPEADLAADSPTLRVAIIGAGPAGLTLAIALARRAAAGAAVRATVFERADDHRGAATYNPDRSYTIDITGHGARAAHYVGAAGRFDASLIPFLGLRIPSLYMEERAPQPGWTGSRGDICRALQAELEAAAGDAVTVCFGTDAAVVSAADGLVELRSAAAAGGDAARCEAFDLVVGCDGAGSAVRRVLQAQQPGFTVESSELANHSTMLALDLAGSKDAPRLDKSWLYVLSPPKIMMVAGAICGPGGRDDPLWFCQIGRAGKHSFASPEEARRLLVSAYPAVEKLSSAAAIEAFSRREAMPTGRAKACSALHGGRVALLGDAGAPFPPVGQGVNAAMEAATVLDACLGEQLEALRAGAPKGGAAAFVEAALAAYTSRWAPEAAAVRAIAHGLDLDSSLAVVVKQWLYNHLGVSALTNAKDARLSYAQALAVERRADAAFVALAVAAVVAAVALGVARFS